MKIENIETDRLIIRGFTKDDALWAYKIWNDPLMGKYLPDEAKEDIDWDYIKELELLGEDEECCYLIPVLKESGERVGTCSFMISEDLKVYDIAYCIHNDLWGRGFATEIAEGLIDYARNKKAEKVTILINQENEASKRVAEKCGGKIVSENTFIKKGTKEEQKEFIYEVIL